MKLVNPKLEGFFLGSQFVSSIVGGIVIGFLADQEFNTSPLWMLVGLAFGIATAFSFIIRYAKLSENRKKGS